MWSLIVALLGEDDENDYDDYDEDEDSEEDSEDEEGSEDDDEEQNIKNVSDVEGGVVEDIQTQLIILLSILLKCRPRLRSRSWAPTGPKTTTWW
jgi:CBS domain containing-hemolysin-like protein